MMADQDICIHNIINNLQVDVYIVHVVGCHREPHYKHWNHCWGKKDLKKHRGNIVRNNVSTNSYCMNEILTSFEVQCTI